MDPFSCRKRCANSVALTSSDKTWVEISASRLIRNFREIRHLVAPSSVMAVIKANAYGHGMGLTARVLAREADWFGVDHVDEALALRGQGIHKPILVLGHTLKTRVRDAVKHDVSFVAYDPETVRAAAEAATKKHPARVHLKIETGLYRQGATIEEALSLARAIRRAPHMVLEGASTHFANIEDTRDNAYAMKQLSRFNAALTALKKIGADPTWKHTACSAAAMLYPETRFNLARAGIAMYGLWPSQTTLVSARSRGLHLSLQPVLTWKTVVAQVKRVSRGEPVSYGLTERVKRDSVIAILPVGYWDGYDRGLSRQGEALVRGRRCRIIGRVCMNMCAVDITDAPRVHTEDEVVLLGQQGKEEITAEEIAERIGTIHYEIVARINPLLKRKLVG